MRDLLHAKTSTLKCRSLGHAWDPKRAFVEREGRTPVLRVELQCMRCKLPRTDVTARRTRELLHRTYGYNTIDYMLEHPKRYGSRAQLNATTRGILYERLVDGA